MIPEQPKQKILFLASFLGKRIVLSAFAAILLSPYCSEASAQIAERSKTPKEVFLEFIQARDKRDTVAMYSVSTPWHRKGVGMSRYFTPYGFVSKVEVLSEEIYSLDLPAQITFREKYYSKSERLMDSITMICNLYFVGDSWKVGHYEFADDSKD